MIPHGFSLGDTLHVSRQDGGQGGVFILQGDVPQGIVLDFQRYEDAPKPVSHLVNDVVTQPALAPLDRVRNLTALIDAATKDRLQAMQECRSEGVAFSKIGEAAGMTGVGIKGILDREFPATPEPECPTTVQVGDAFVQVRPDGSLVES
jgi:hypothetical protein